jgi:hypothetical protein
MSFNKIEKQRIYKHTELDQREADALKPLMENAFKSEFDRYVGPRAAIKNERLRFVTEQFANRARIARNMGETPLNEDAKIFGQSMPSLKKLFEDAPVIGMGDVVNPGSSSTLTGGIWNSAYKPGSGDIPSYVFGLQNHIALNCIGFDLIPTIAVDTPKIMVSYVDTVYGGGTFDDKDNLPSFIELASSVFTRTWIKAQALKRATTEVILVSALGTTGTVTGKAMKVRFMLGSTVKSAITVEVLATGTTSTAWVTGPPATTTITYTWDNSVTVKDVSDAVNASVTAKVMVATPTDGTAGTAITAVAIGYASAIRQNIAEAASNDNSLGGMSRKQHEKGPKHKLNVIAMDKQLEMVGLEIEADTSNIQIKDMAAIGVNVISHLYTGVQNQLVQSLDECILNHLYAMGVQHAVNVYQSQGVNYSLFIDTPTNATLAVSAIDVKFEDMTGTDVRTNMGNLTNALVSAAYENQMTHGERLYARILLILEFVAQQNRIAPPDFIVVAGTLASCLKKQSTFSACPVTTSFSANPELHYAGTIFETVNVYKNPKVDFDDPRILFGRRGTDTDPGSKFLAYDLAASRQTIDPTMMAEKIRVWSRFQIADIGFYPELNYYTAIMINKYNWA